MSKVQIDDSKLSKIDKEFYNEPREYLVHWYYRSTNLGKVIEWSNETLIGKSNGGTWTLNLINDKYQIVFAAAKKSFTKSSI